MTPPKLTPPAPPSQPKRKRNPEENKNDNDGRYGSMAGRPWDPNQQPPRPWDTGADGQGDDRFYEKQTASDENQHGLETRQETHAICFTCPGIDRSPAPPPHPPTNHPLPLPANRNSVPPSPWGWKPKAACAGRPGWGRVTDSLSPLSAVHNMIFCQYGAGWGDWRLDKKNCDPRLPRSSPSGTTPLPTSSPFAPPPTPTPSRSPSLPCPLPPKTCLPHPSLPYTRKLLFCYGNLLEVYRVV